MEKLLQTIFIGLVTAAALSVSAQAGETTFSGFVDMSYLEDSNSDKETFVIDQAELDIDHTIDAKASLRIDLQFVNTADDPLTPGVDESRPTMDDTVEQGYISVRAGESTLTFGKFNAPIGFELLDPPDMYQYSHAMVFSYGLPTNLTGAMMSGGNAAVNYAIYYVNGWDKNPDNNTNKHVGTRIGFTSGEILNLGFSYISGKIGTATKVNQTITDIDLTFTPSEKFTLGAEYNMGVVEKSSNVDSGDAKWTGYLVMMHFTLNDIYGLTLRYDTFEDDDDYAINAGFGKEKRNATTVALTFGIAEGLGGLIEMRNVKSDVKVFTDKNNNAKDNESTVAAELTFSF